MIELMAICVLLFFIILVIIFGEEKASMDLFVVVKTRTEAKRSYYKRKDGMGEEYDWFSLPVGSVYILDDGSHIIKIWANREKTETTFFRPQHPNENNNNQGWVVTGEAPNITCSPSIFVAPPNGWHGHIKDGKLLDA